MLRIKNLLLFLFLLIFFQAKSQNLVPNPSFENTITLPCEVIQSGSEFSNSLQNWTLPTGGTSDIYSTLAPQTCNSNCFSARFGPQAPRTGNTMCGFYIYEFSPLVYREYLQVELLSPLIIGKRYYAEMHVSLADLLAYGSNNIGMAFSDTQIGMPNYTEVIPLTPEVKSTTVIIDSENWVKISGTFIATTAARYVTIGNFYDNANTVATLKNNSYYREAYYYIDDILVELDCHPKDSSSTICKGSSITLDLNNSYITGWSLASSPNTIISNTSTLVVTPLVTTSYIAHYDCGPTSTFEVIVDPMPTFSLGKDSTLCQGESIFFDATTEHATYIWQDGSTNPTYTARTTGLYTLTITNGCSSIHDEVFIQVNKPASFSFGTDTTICSGETITFNATTDGASYLWQDGTTNPVYTVTDTGYYSITIKNNCGISNKNITLHICCAGARIPNLITPNGDGKNETFYIDCFGNGDYELIIYNTWGAVIYENNTYLNNWGGEHVSDGIYYYVIRYKTKSINNGWVQVLR